MFINTKTLINKIKNTYRHNSKKLIVKKGFTHLPASAMSVVIARKTAIGSRLLNTTPPVTPPPHPHHYHGDCQIISSIVIVSGVRGICIIINLFVRGVLSQRSLDGFLCYRNVICYGLWGDVVFGVLVFFLLIFKI